MTTKANRVLEGLKKNDRGLTAAQIESRYGVRNARATVSALRFKGYAIYSNKHTDAQGRRRVFYRLGTPSRDIVAAGYRARAAGLY